MPLTSQHGGIHFAIAFLLTPISRSTADAGVLPMETADTSGSIGDHTMSERRPYGITPTPTCTPLLRMDAQGRVMRDILGYFRETLADAGDALYRPIFDRHIMRHYTPREKAAFDPAVDALAAEGLLEKREGT